MDNIAKRCDIIYECTDSPDIPRTLVSIKTLKEQISRDWQSHINKYGSPTKNCEISRYEDLNFTDEAGSIFHGSVVSNPVYNPVRVARVAMSIADIRDHFMIRVSDVTNAMNWYKRIQ